MAQELSETQIGEIVREVLRQMPGAAAPAPSGKEWAVSYTHLTLPTKLEV